MEEKENINGAHLFYHFVAKDFVHKELFRLTEGDPERISFLFDEELSATKRYERFEKKKMAELLIYFKERTPMADEVDELGMAIMIYLFNILVIRGDMGPFIYKSAIAETVEGKTVLLKALKAATGIEENEDSDGFDVVDCEKTNAFMMHIETEARKIIKNTLVSKAFYDKQICESNYTLATVFTDTEKEIMMSSIIQSAVNYMIFNSEMDITPNALYYEGLQTNKNVQIDRLVQDCDKLQKENENLKKKLLEKSKSKTTKTPAKKIVDNPELIKENKALKNEIEELKVALEELEAIFDIAENNGEEQTDVLRDVREDKILFVGGHDNELRKLKYIFKNSESFVKCSMDIQANYLSGFDYIVFLAHYSSHALYHKIKGLADLTNVPYIHCEYNNPKLIAEYIAKHFPHKDQD